MSAAQRRLRVLKDEITATAPSLSEARIADLVSEVQLALQEVEVAHEELRQQNEELLGTREALEIQRHRYLHLFEHAPYGYLVTDLQGIVEEANQAACSLFDVAPWALQGKPLALFVTEEDRPILRSLIPRVGEAAQERELTLKPRSREPFAAVLTAVRDLDDAGKVQRLRWMVRDVSRRRAAEAALRDSEERLRHARRLEAIGRLAGGVAHSFNNLLAGISFHSELLGEQLGKDDPRQAHVAAIQSAGERAAVLARQLLAFGRKQVLQPRVLSAGRVISDMEPILRRLIGENIELVTELAPDAGLIDADPGQLEQVILNLVVNARDAMPFGGRLTLATASAEIPPEGEPGLDLPPGRYLKIAVADTGTGMSQEVRARLFEPFFTTKDRDKGTGLGLSTVHGIVHQSGGGIAVESTPGEGSRFLVYLPVAQRPADARPAPSRSFQSAAQGSEVILLVEDEQNIREPAAEILESRGYTVLAAADAAEALGICAAYAGRIHLMITDVVMPGMSGGQLAERLTAERPDLQVVYISGYPEDSIAHHGVLSAEKVFLQKPFSAATLLGRVREILDNVAATAATAG
jgi:two-component system cell cycle sensor histidine kinase/response regulator CckA